MNKSTILTIIIGLILVIHVYIAYKVVKPNSKSSKKSEPIITKVTALTLDRTPKPKPTIKKTLAYKAYKKLANDNMINEPMITVMYVLQKIDKDVRTIKVEDGILKMTYQTFEFSDCSQLKITKQIKNGEYKILPYGTKVID